MVNTRVLWSSATAIVLAAPCVAQPPRAAILAADPDAGEIVHFRAETVAELGAVSGLRRPMHLRAYERGMHVIEPAVDLPPSRVVRLSPTGVMTVFLTLDPGLSATGFLESAFRGQYLAIQDGVYINYASFSGFSGFHAAPGGAQLRGLLGDTFECYPDFDIAPPFPVLDLFDDLEFARAYAATDPRACNCDLTTGMNVCDVFDFLCFTNLFAFGCP